MCHIFTIHSSVDEHLNCLQFHLITNRAAMNLTHLCKDAEYFGTVLWTGTATSCGGSVVNIWRILHTDFHSFCVYLHSHQQQISSLSHIILSAAAPLWFLQSLLAPFVWCSLSLQCSNLHCRCVDRDDKLQN